MTQNPPPPPEDVGGIVVTHIGVFERAVYLAILIGFVLAIVLL